MNKKNWEMKIGGIIILSFLIWGGGWFLFTHFIKGNWSFPYSPASDMTKELILPFTREAILGTDIYGRSVFELLSEGLVYSLSVGIFVSLISASIGIFVGHMCVVGTSFTKKLAELIMNLIFIFPSILIAILIMSILERSVWGLVFALSVTGWPGYARIVRGESQRIMALSFIESAKAVGITNFRLFFSHVFPMLLPLILVHLVLGMSGVIISEATLGFLGLGGSEFSWGGLLSIAKMVLLEAPQLVIIISFVLAMLIIGLNLLGDALRDHLDPKKNMA